MQLGIRLHDVNAALPLEQQSRECRVGKAKEEGFSCVLLPLAKSSKASPSTTAR